MIVALGTLPFLATLWLLIVLGAKVLEESGGKIAAALKGNSEQPVRDMPVRFRTRPQVRQSMRANVEWRAAA